MARGIINITGLYSRWDILSLLVRENEYEPTVPMGSLQAGSPRAAEPDLKEVAPFEAAATAPDSDGLAELRERVSELERKVEALGSFRTVEGPT